MEKILSIVIPSYNVEKFLRQTLASFVDESVLDKIEVLIVNDGSKDGTEAIGKEYEKKYPQTFRVISKENGGHGSTINRGIEECTGKYFKVIDGDDWVNTSDFKTLVEKLETCEADYVITNYYEVYVESGKRVPVEYKNLLKTSDDMEWNGTFEDIVGKVIPAMHALVLRSSILKEHQVRLDEHCFYVDVEYVLYPLPYVEKVVYYDLYVYMYRLGQVTQSVSIEGFRKHIDNHITVCTHLTTFVESYRKCSEGKNQKKIEYIGKRVAQMIGDQVTIFMSYPANNQAVRQQFIKFDREIKSSSRWMYELSAKESGILRLLRMTGFCSIGYKTIMRIGQKRNHMEHVIEKV